MRKVDWVFGYLGVWVFAETLNTHPPVSLMIFQASWRLFCGSGFPAATIEAESLPQQASLLANNAPGVMAR
jgi:hypothetical protein